MRSVAERDALDQLADEIASAAAAAGMAVARGWVKRSKEAPVIHFEDDGPDAWRRFVDLARSLNATAVVLSRHPYREVDYDEAMAEAHFLPSKGERDSRIDELQEIAHHIGMVARLNADGVGCRGGFSIAFQRFAPWTDVAYASEQPATGGGRPALEERIPLPKDVERINTLALRVVDDPRFEDVTSGTHDSVTARLLLELGVRPESDPLYPLIERQVHRLWHERKDEFQQRQVAKAVALRKQGLSIHKVAVALGKSDRQVERLLAIGKQA